jgi:N-acetylmuramoyl-L-alanine amidase
MESQFCITFYNKFMLQLLLAVVSVFFSLGLHAAAIQAVDLERHADKTRIVFNLSEEVTFKFFTLDNPDRVVIDFQGIKKTVSFKALNLDNSPIRRIRTAMRGANTRRVVLDLNDPVLTDHMATRTSDQEFQLGFDLKSIHAAFHNTGQPSAEKYLAADKPSGRPPATEEVSAGVASSKSKVAEPAAVPPRDVVIAVDAGHGGEDPGAIGPKGTFEKDVVLAISKKLVRAINTHPGYKAVLVRTGDYYIPLSQRRDIARHKHKADLFLSIHADAFKRRSAHGASVYALSRKGASSALARHLAAHERIVSVPPKESKLLNTVLADLAMEGSMEHSMRVGNYVLNELQGVTKMHKPRVEKRAFAVLKSTDVPSLLIETGFISNPQEERKLLNSRHQNRLVKAITEGVQRYFEKQPPPNTWLALWKQAPPDKHRIARGETLSSIAARYRVSQERLKRANNLRSDLILIGQVLRIPSS